jgi:hypothetical protein
MNRLSLTFSLVFAIAAGAVPGCNCASLPGGDGFDPNGDGFNPNGDGGNPNGDGGTNPCGSNDPSCTVTCIGPNCQPPSQFPLPTDNPAPENVKADGVNRNPMGHIVLDSSKASFDFLWVANENNYGRGTVSKIDSKPRTNAPAGAINTTYRETARYVTVTCFSDPTVGSLSTCDGTNGCCSRGPAGSRGAIQLTGNRPSRTAVDFNGDVWVSNRAFGGQQSITKIANRNNSIVDTACLDRNLNGVIESSSDVNGDGIIDTDCNRDNLPDDRVTVCTGGRAKEFWGLDDECILFTTNTGPGPDGVGRSLALGPGGAGDAGPSDAYAGLYNSASTAGMMATFYRIDGTTGLIKGTIKFTQTNGINPQPYGAVVDQFGILWAPQHPNEGAALWYADTNNTANKGMIQPPAALGSSNGFYGVAIDGYTDPMNNQLVQQIWLANYGGGDGKAFRYRPVRGLGFAALGTGTWAHVRVPGVAGSGRGVGVDNRMPTSYAWIGIDGSASILKIPTNIADGVTNLTATNVFSTAGGAGTIGTGVAADLDIWAVNHGSHSATHFKVDALGNVTPPAAADQVRLDDNLLGGGAAHTAPNPYTYSDFTGFGLRNFTNPRGTYTWRQLGCGPGKTKWLKLTWDADTPPLTKLVARVRSADDTTALGSATSYGDFATSPAELELPPGPVMPNPSGYLEVEFVLSTMDKNLTPALKSFSIVYECVNGLQ